MSADGDIRFRRAVPADRGAVVRLLGASLGREDDPRYEALFVWKHEDNAFGPSPAWVALDGESIVGYRALMRWRFERGQRVVDAVRAVDTATDPEYQGRGIFSRLTRSALAELRAEGVGFVFNTPNEQSRPGYLKMGWQVVGRLPVSVRPGSIGGAVRMVTARVAADRWSAPCESGRPAGEVLRDHAALVRLLEGQPPSLRLRTARTPEFLGWRYGSSVMPYRALVAGGGPAEGLLLFRLRRRGKAREAVIGDVLAPAGDAGVVRNLLVRLRREVDADYMIRIGGGVVARDGFVRLPRQGPILTWRALSEASMPALADWRVTLGDIEVF